MIYFTHRYIFKPLHFALKKIKIILTLKCVKVLSFLSNRCFGYFNVCFPKCQVHNDSHNLSQCTYCLLLVVIFGCCCLAVQYLLCWSFFALDSVFILTCLVPHIKLAYRALFRLVKVILKVPSCTNACSLIMARILNWNFVKHNFSHKMLHQNLHKNMF